MNIIGLYPNIKRDRNLSVTKELIRILSDYQVTLLAEEKLEKELKGASPRLEFVSSEGLFQKSQCLVTLGGDGTILSVAKRAAQADLPIFGINLGNVGFMAALEKKELSQITRLFTGEYTVSSRMLLSCLVNGEEKLCALNECVIAPEKRFHIMELCLDIGKRKLCDFRADGLIFHTPTGSTGYAFSAGGAVMDGEFDAIGVKAIASYLLINAHHMIFSPDTEFCVRDCHSVDSRITVCADGREEITLNEGDTVSICRSEKRVQLITLDQRSNQEVFFRKF